MAEINWQQESLETIIRYWQKDYKLPEGAKASPDYIVDPVKGIVLFKFYVEDDKEKETPPE